MLYNLTPNPSCYSLKCLNLFVTGVFEQQASENSCTQRHDDTFLRHGDTIITSGKHDKQSQSSADFIVNVSLPKLRVRSRDCSMFCVENANNWNIKFHLGQLQWKSIY